MGDLWRQELGAGLLQAGQQCSRASGNNESARSCVPVWRAWDRAPSLGFPAQAQGLALSSPSPASLEGAAEQGGVHAPLLPVLRDVTSTSGSG